MGPCLAATPPLTRAADRAEGEEILDEVPSALGVVLWEALRDIMAWLETPAEERARLFGPEAERRRQDEVRAARVEADLWGPLLTLVDLTARPDRVDVLRLVYACRRLATWAEEHRAPATRLAFAQAAALLLPLDAGLALEAARLARDLAQYARAETWFRTAVKVARGRDWTSYVWAHVGLAILYRRVGNQPAAWAVAGRALRAARRRGLPAMEGRALHDLFVFASDVPDLGQAIRFARDALSTYHLEHPRLPWLAHDVACLWCDQAQFPRALPLIQGAVHKIRTERPEEAILAAANLARAAAGVGHREVYEQACKEVRGRMLEVSSGSQLSDIFITLARAQAFMGDWESASQAAAQALDIATRREEVMLQSIAMQEVQAANERSLAALLGVQPEKPGMVREADKLTEDLLDAIRRTP